MSRPQLAYGARGAAVQQLQRLLGLKPDGLFGPGTRTAVQAYQRRLGVTPDGVVGPDTWAVLEGGLPETRAAASWGAARAPFVLRLPSGWQVTSGYGPRGNPPQNHAGVDLAGVGWETDPPAFLSPCPGEVVAFNAADPWGGGYGFWMLLREPGGLEFFAGHLSVVHVGVGRIDEGQPLGRFGNSGHSYGVHLHAETRRGDSAFNPESVLRVEDLLHGQGVAA